MHNAKQNSGEHWIDDPTAGALFANQNCSSGVPCPKTARRITVVADGLVYLIPVGQTAASEYPWADGITIPAGTVITQQCDGIGASNTAVLVVQF